MTVNDLEVVYALDFDGVLVDSAAETGRSGLRAARALFPDQQWVKKGVKDDDGDNDYQQQHLSDIIARFIQVRPILYVGWESIVLCQLLGDPALGSPSVARILKNFHGDDGGGACLKAKAMKHARLQDEDYHHAFKEARDAWIVENNGRDWIDAHGFFDGACQAVRDFVQTKRNTSSDSESDNKHANERLYVITTKAKNFALSLLEQQRLFDPNNPNDPTKIQESHIFGLGSGSKASVLSNILADHDERRRIDRDESEKTSTPKNASSNCQTIAVMVEDNIATLQKIERSEIGDRVLNVVAPWGYNTAEQLRIATNEGYVSLRQDDSGSLKDIFDDTRVRELYSKRNTKKR
mmetsp:Transcript_59839/g.146966  ORF Transcript_59839/g.146966 Transcript_59839/m.146966 type:complete len:351 (+) Transcript_59839:946-1998(+)